jgi:hypothetical protein
MDGRLSRGGMGDGESKIVSVWQWDGVRVGS